MKKVFFSLVLIFTLNFAVTAQKENDWAPVVSAAELAGYWTGSKAMEIPQNEATGIPNSILVLTINLNYSQNNKDIIFEMVIEFNKFLEDWIEVPTMKNLKMTKDQLWNLLKGLLQNILGEEATYDDSYKLFYIITVAASPFEPSGNFCINGPGNMVKLLFDDPISFGLGDEGLTEMILVRMSSVVL